MLRLNLVVILESIIIFKTLCSRNCSLRSISLLCWSLNWWRTRCLLIWLIGCWLRAIKLAQRKWSLKSRMRTRSFSLRFPISNAKLKYTFFILLILPFYLLKIIMVDSLFCYNSFDIKRNNISYFIGGLLFLLFTSFYLLHHYFTIDWRDSFDKKFRIEYFSNFVIWFKRR